MYATIAAPIVYVLDDDTSICHSLERLVRSVGLEVRSFSSASEFLDFAPPDRPSCLVADVRMPGLSGLDLQEWLATSGRTLPMIFITGHGTVPMSVRAMRAGAVNFLQKPFEDSGGPGFDSPGHPSRDATAAGREPGGRRSSGSSRRSPPASARSAASSSPVTRTSGSPISWGRARKRSRCIAPA